MRPVFVRTLLACWAAVSAAVVALYGGSGMDDFFIFYRYADNLARGRGFVFNVGERVFGLTEPAYGAALGVFEFVTRIPAPWLGSLATAAGLLALGWILRREAEPRGQEAEALVGGTLAVALTFFWVCRGAGVIPGLALLALSARLRSRPVLGGIAGALAAGFRPELALGLLFAWLFGHSGERVARRRFAGAVAGGGALLAGSLWLWFGRVTPITLGAKQDFAAWNPAARASGSHFWPGFVPMLERHWGRTWPLFFAIGLLGCLLVLRRGGPAMRTIVATGLALAIVYPLLGVPLFGWYTIPTLAAAVYGFAFATVGALRAIAKRAAATPWPVPRLWPLLFGGMLVLLLVTPFRSLAWGLTHPDESQHYVSYRDAGRFIRAHSPPEARISALEVGTLAYFSDRTVVDLLGLVSPSSLANVATRNVIETLRADPTEWFVLTTGLEGLIGPVRTLPWFEERYELAHELPAVEGQVMWVYRKKT